MLTQRSRVRLILGFGLSLVTAWSMVGCGGASSAGGTAAPISPDRSIPGTPPAAIQGNPNDVLRSVYTARSA